MEILPAIDLRGGQCVRLRQGDYAQETVFSKDPVQMAQRWQDEGATRLHLVDLDGAKEGRPVNTEIIRAIVKQLTIPVQLGGGIRDTETVEMLINDIGLDRAIVGTKALKDPDWFLELASQFPGHTALGLDARDSMVATEGWLEVSETSAIDLARKFAGAPVAAVIYTNIANDGMMQGVDDQTIKDMISLTELGLPVIASGGVTTMEDVTRLRDVSTEHPKLVGAIVGRALYEGTIQLVDAIG